MNRFEEGDRVRVDIPDKDDPDYDRWHGTIGTVVDVRDNAEYRVEGDDGASMWFRWRDVRPAGGR